MAGSQPRARSGVVRPSTADPTRVRVIVPWRDRILLVQHRDADGLFWILPGGGVKPGETLEEAAAREVREEAGADCRIVRRLDLPAGVDGMAGYGLFLGSVETDALEPSQSVDGEVVHAAAWHRISDTEPIGPLTPRLWSPIAPLFKTILSGRVNGGMAETTAETQVAPRDRHPRRHR